MRMPQSDPTEESLRHGRLGSCSGKRVEREKLPGVTCYICKVNAQVGHTYRLDIPMSIPKKLPSSDKDVECSAVLYSLRYSRYIFKGDLSSHQRSTFSIQACKVYINSFAIKSTTTYKYTTCSFSILTPLPPLPVPGPTLIYIEQSRRPSLPAPLSVNPMLGKQRLPQPECLE